MSIPGDSKFRANAEDFWWDQLCLCPNLSSLLSRQSFPSGVNTPPSQVRIAYRGELNFALHDDIVRRLPPNRAFAPKSSLDELKTVPKGQQSEPMPAFSYSVITKLPRGRVWSLL